MSPIELGINALVTIVITYISFEVKRLRMKAEDAVSKAEVKEMIQDKTEILTKRHEDIKEDLCRLENKIDKLLESQIK